MNYTLKEVQSMAKDETAMITLNKKVLNPTTTQEIWTTFTCLATVAYENMSKPIAERTSGWKRIFLTRKGNTSFPPEELKLDQNSLSESVLEQLKDLGFTRDSQPENPVVEIDTFVPIAITMSDLEMFEHLKSQGLLHGKVKFKGEHEELAIEELLTESPVETNPLNEATENETA